jgi:hypothetical protein
MMLSGDEIDKASDKARAAWDKAHPLQGMLDSIEHAGDNNQESISGDKQQ